MKDKITKGKVLAGYMHQSLDTGGTVYIIGNGSKSSSTHTTEEAIANIDLIEQAFNTTNECGFTPSELLKQRNELLEALKEVQKQFNKDGNMTGHLYGICQQAIENTTK